MAAVLLQLVLGLGDASAHQQPPNCNANNLALNPSSDKTVVRNGDTISYTVTIANLDTDNQIACDVTGATVTLSLPAADGTPTGSKVTLASGVDYPAGTALSAFPPVTYTVAVNPGVTNVEIEAEAAGVVHRAEENRARIVKTLSTRVTQPHTTLSVTADPASGDAPLTVNYTYTEKNDSSTDAPISGVRVSDENCSPVTLAGGDANGNSVLDTGESWVFTCSRTFDRPGTYVSRVSGTGLLVVDAREAPLETAETTVNVSSPPVVSGGRQPLPVTAGPAARYLLGGSLLLLAGLLLLLGRRRRSAP